MIKHLEKSSLKIRERALDLKNKKVRITNYYNSDQAKDLTKSPNCNGFGRIKHFKLEIDNWINDPLPMLPASKALKLPISECSNAQVFQISACNLNCWYCFVDKKLRCNNPGYSSFLTCSDLIDLLVKEEEIPHVIDLSGGQPDLVPEWTLWMMKELSTRGLQSDYFLWSDDNLSTDFFWRYLTENDIEFIENYSNYAKVCCFKGFDPISFKVNTGKDGVYFKESVKYFEKLIKTNINLFSYITLTAPPNTNFVYEIPKFFDTIQRISENYLLRIIPLKIIFYTPSKKENDLLIGQNKALEIWQNELSNRFDSIKLNSFITDISYK